MSAKYALIRREEGAFPTGLMIAWMGVSSSGYYDWRDRPPSARALRRRELAVIVRWHFEDSDGTYGYRRIAAAMNAAGQHVDPGTVASVMAHEGLVAAQPRRSGPRTTIPARDLAQVPDLVQRDFTAAEPGVKLVGDITYISTWEGWVYLAGRPPRSYPDQAHDPGTAKMSRSCAARLINTPSNRSAVGEDAQPLGSHDW